MTVENVNQDPADEIEINVTDDPVEGAEAKASPDDELERYTKQVSRRINKLNQKSREAEERAAQLEALAMQKEQELAQYRQQNVQYQRAMLDKEEESLKAKEQQVDDIYRKAVASGDADLMSKADTLKNEIAIQKEKLRVAKGRQAPEQPAEQENYQQYQQPVPQQYMEQEPAQQEVKPTEQALSWHERNPWYGNSEDPDSLAATQLAYFTHFNLLNEGYEADSNEYYEELDKRVYRAYPNFKSEQAPVESAKGEERPPVQRVASAAPSSRQKTPNQRGVTFTKSELERLRRLKPHNLSEDAWLKRVAKEKQRIAAREAI